MSKIKVEKTAEIKLCVGCGYNFVDSKLLKPMSAFVCNECRENTELMKELESKFNKEVKND